MSLLLSCACGKFLRVPDTAAGRQVRCPACGGVLTAPAAEEPDSAEPANYAVRDADAPPPAAEPAPRRERPVRWKSRRGEGRKRAQKQVYLGCGFLSIVAGLLLLILTLVQEEWSGKVLVGGVTLAVIGVVSIVQALTNTMPDDWKDLDSF
ncbi:hypothetical protein [Urbifossiella limnaea]|uniref:Uncharacterized protein n=1 Tax=Urbifossiella limnaea TaxID=2528023 RepID=A0A517XX77_9BACT|nr:hypothetical protein [Urbifossiella limnaea]QDU22117.1 hypothetical protein ETAA1_40930 [Urbifossiella limnaea]